MKITPSIHLLSIALIISFSSAFSQTVAINEDGSNPDPSSILDVKSNSKGILVPRLTSAQRTAINPAAVGLLVFDIDTESFWFRQSTSWIQLISEESLVTDIDQDTKIQVEESPDDDQIRFDIAGYQGMILRENSQGAAVLDFGTDLGLIIGHQAGEHSIAGFNTFVGYKAAENNTFGQRNVIVGYHAGQKNIDVNRGVIIGYEAGLNNDATGNTFLGYQSGRNNTTGHSNVFVGYESGTKNTEGYRNTFLGYNSGKNTLTGFQNTFIGFNSGLFNTTGEHNVFLGTNAGSANRTGNRNTFVGFGSGSNPLSSVDMGDKNTALGFEAGYKINGGANNILIGDKSGYNISNGKLNILIGNESGMFVDDDSLNIGIGHFSLRNNNIGNSNLAIGDSSLLSNDGSNNLAFGSNAGDENTNGNNNIFIGAFSGKGNWGESNNIFIGHNTSLDLQTNANGSIGIGHNVEIATNNSIVLGDPQNQLMKTGIGTNNPQAKLTVFSDLPGSIPLLEVESNLGPSFTAFPNQGASIGSGNIPPDQGLIVQGFSYLRDTVAVLTSVPAKGYALSVNGDIACEEVRIQNSLAWPDYVFDEEYSLMPLEDLEKVLLNQRHLPGVPSAKEIEENGILMNHITVELLEKIEELYLYVLVLNQEINELKEKNKTNDD